jgi:putative spermidine/putrescine transport system permease protein
VLSQVNPELLDAASTLGANPVRRFIKVILPLSMPGIVTSSVFIVSLVMGEFSTPLIVGGGVNPMLASSIVTEVNMLQWPLAATISMVLIAIILIIVTLLFRVADIREQI